MWGGGDKGDKGDGYGLGDGMEKEKLKHKYASGAIHIF